MQEKLSHLLTNEEKSSIMEKTFTSQRRMESNFDNKKYLHLLTQELAKRVDQTSGKLYVEINGKLLKDDFATRIFYGYDGENKRKLIAEIKQDLEILVCINAKHIIENTPMTKKGIPCIQHIELTLKRIETAAWIKPQVVITHINIEEMYDLIFSFEKKFQKKGYKVRENYLKKGFPTSKNLLLSENGFGNDDHIPIMKKIAFVTGIGTESGKLDTCIGQIYSDHEIGLNSSFCMLQTLPLSELSSEHPINQAWLKKRENEILTQDDFWETVEDSSQESFRIMKDLLDDQLEEDNLIRTYKKVSDMIICPTLSCIADLSKAEALAQQEL